MPDSLDRRAAWRWANDHFGMPIQIRGGGTAATRVAPSQRVVAAADKIERGALAGVIAHRELLPMLAEIPADHFHDEGVPGAARPPRRRRPPSDETLALLAELDAWAPEEGIDKATAETYLLRMTERQVQTELRQAPLERLPELTETLVRIRDTIEALDAPTPTAPD